MANDTTRLRSSGDMLPTLTAAAAAADAAVPLTWLLLLAAADVGSESSSDALRLTPRKMLRGAAVAVCSSAVAGSTGTVVRDGVLAVAAVPTCACRAGTDMPPTAGGGGGGVPAARAADDFVAALIVVPRTAAPCAAFDVVVVTDFVPDDDADAAAADVDGGNLTTAEDGSGSTGAWAAEAVAEADDVGDVFAAHTTSNSMRRNASLPSGFD